MYDKQVEADMRGEEKVAKIINELNAMRIRDDAYIACDALQSLINSPKLHENYIREKLDVVRRCIKFIENFEAKDNE